MTAIPIFSKGRSGQSVSQVQDWLARGRREIFWVQAFVTPDIAAELLGNNPNNRAMKNPVVEKYAGAMQRGEWHLNGQDVIVALSGELNDGQKRLQAIINTGCTVELGLKFGVARETRSTLDVGQKRSLGDHFTMKEYANANVLAATVRLAWCYDNGIYSLSQAPSVSQALDYVKANPGIHEFLRVGARIGSDFGTSGAQFGFAAYVCARINHRIADCLIHRVQDGLGLNEKNLPGWRVRERLQQHSIGKPILRRNEPSAIFIKAFNAALVGRRLRSLSWTHTGSAAEPFPIAGA